MSKVKHPVKNFNQSELETEVCGGFRLKYLVWDNQTTMDGLESLVFR